jgi:hypothetical protein
MASGVIRVLPSISIAGRTPRRIMARTFAVRHRQRRANSFGVRQRTNSGMSRFLALEGVG